MINTLEMKKVELILDEDQLCTLLTMVQHGFDVKNGHSRSDQIEIIKIMQDALVHLI